MVDYEKEKDMGKAIKIYKTGGPEVLIFEDFDPGPPGPGQALIRHWV
jgi:NADPH2:quinone reductase